MRRSDERILTTHAGSLPYRDNQRAPTPEAMREAVRGVVGHQRDVGLDLINDGEYAKGGTWLSFADDRFNGFEAVTASDETPLMERGWDRERFADFYRYAGERGVLFYSPLAEQPRGRQRTFRCIGPISYRGQEALGEELELLASSDAGEDAFVTSTTPHSLAVYRQNLYYPSDEEYLFAFADALREEYEAIVAGGFVLQVDDAWLNGMWERMDIDFDQYLEYTKLRIEALNHALRNVPEERVRYHMCWGSWHGPHAFDVELSRLVNQLLEIHAQAYVLEGANARHEHEWAVWETTELPAGKILVPGVITHSTNVIEHPELVAQRIERYARLVGRENVIAGADCGFGGRAHPQIAWAKLESLAEGARIASSRLWS